MVRPSSSCLLRPVEYFGCGSTKNPVLIRGGQEGESFLPEAQALGVVVLRELGEVRLPKHSLRTESIVDPAQVRLDVLEGVRLPRGIGPVTDLHVNPLVAGERDQVVDGG